jgi:hypothetical protein
MFFVWYTYRNMPTAGIVNAPPNKKNAPGSVFRVAAYTVVYIGAYTSGIKASATPNNEFTFPGKIYGSVKKKV